MSPTPMVVLMAEGLPAPQGSKLRTRWGMADDNAKTLKPWRAAVTAAARAAMEGREPLTGPLEVRMNVVMPRPKSHHGTGRNAARLRASAPRRHATRPDVDKLARAVLDGMTQGGVWHDDGQVDDLHVRKQWSGSGPFGAASGVVVVVIPEGEEQESDGDEG